MTNSTALQDALRESDLLSDWIERHFPLKYQETGHLHIAMSLYAIAGEHREAFILLLKNDARTSAFALARSVYESFMRGLWAESLMTPQQYSLALQRKEFPKFESIISALNKVAGANGAIEKSRRLLWGPLSDFAHAGFRQIFKWIGKDGIGPTHSDKETVQMLGLVDLYGLCAFMQASQLARLPPKDIEVQVANVLRRLRDAVADGNVPAPIVQA